jgi:hypothetical protein
VITRVEIDGFKSFLDFELDVPPFLALVGPNASGKSNLFDAISYDESLRVRDPAAVLGGRRGRPHEQFHRVGEGRPVEAFTLVVHWLVSTPEGFAGVATKSVVGIVDGVPEVVNHSNILDYLDADGAVPLPVAERRWRELPGLFSADTPEEDWFRAADALSDALPYTRQYVPDPQLMRAVASRADRRPLLTNGGNLAAVLGRMSGTDALDDLMIDLAALIPDVTELRAELDEKRQEWSFDLLVEGQGAVPSSLLSDGTLRVLGLLAALHDPDHSGVLLVEEIENGLHPGRLAELLRRIRERVTDLNDPESLGRPLRQVVITSHSPVVVSELYRTQPESLVFMDAAVRVDPDKERVSRVTVAKSVREEGEPGTFVSPRQVRKYLGTVRQDEL